MEREEIRARLMDLADGVLSAEEARRLEAEVRRHPDLEHELKALREAIRLAGRLRETSLPEGLSASIRAAIDATVRPRSVRAIPLWLAGSAAAAVLALVMGYLLLGRSDSPASGARTVLSRANRDARDEVREIGAIRPGETWQAKEDARGEPELADELAEEKALDLLKQVQEEAQGAAGKDALIGSLVLQAIVLQSKPDQALAALERALSLAEPEGYVRTFIDAGAPMSRLLREAVGQGIAPQYAKSLLAALDAERKDGQQPTELPRLATQLRSPLVEPLTDRELQVLRLLTTRLSSTEIADQLFLSPNTVRSHIKNIYSKLDVHSRQGALDRASDLGLLG